MIFASLLTPAGLRAASDWTNVLGIAANTPVRLRTFDGVERQGKFEAADADSVHVVVHGVAAIVQRKDIARVAVHTPSRRGRNIAIGAALGAAVGLFAAVATCPSCIGESTSSDYNQRLGLGVGLGAGIGAGIGALGSPYNDVYKAKRP